MNGLSASPDLGEQRRLLLVAGAPKCGTTSLHQRLAPDCTTGAHKELRYFLEPQHSLARDTTFSAGGWDGYWELFDTPVPSGGRPFLDSTPDYLYTPGLPETLAQSTDVDKQLLFVLRAPEQRVYSLFRFARDRVMSIPARWTFRDFLAAHDARTLPASNPILAQAVAHSSYVTWLQPFFQQLDRSEVAVLLYEEVTASNFDLVGAVPRLAEWGVAATAQPLERANASHSYRSPTLTKLARRVGPVVGPRAKQVFQRLNRAAPRETPAADLEAVADLATRFTLLNEELAAMLGRELTPWEA